MSDLVSYPKDRFSHDMAQIDPSCHPAKALYEPHREKTGFLPRRKQRRRSASR